MRSTRSHIQKSTSTMEGRATYCTTRGRLPSGDHVSAVSGDPNKQESPSTECRRIPRPLPGTRVQVFDRSSGRSPARLLFTKIGTFGQHTSHMKTRIWFCFILIAFSTAAGTDRTKAVESTCAEKARTKKKPMHDAIVAPSALMVAPMAVPNRKPF